MPHFIKTGYWEKAVKTYKGWLDLEQLIASVSPSGNVPTLDEVLSVGNYGYNRQINLQGDNVALSIVGDSTDTAIYQEFSVQRYNKYTDGVRSVGAGILRGANSYILMAPGSTSVDLGLDQILQDNYLYYFASNQNGTLDLTPIYSNSILASVSTGYYWDASSNNSTINNNMFTANIVIRQDAANIGTGSSVNFTYTPRVGLYIEPLKHPDINYANDIAYGIFDNENPIYFGGLLYVGTQNNTVPLVTSATFGKPINYQNSTTNTAGGASGQYLTVYVNGVQRKIALLNV